MLHLPDDPRRDPHQTSLEEAFDGRTARARTEQMRVRPLGGGVYEVESASGSTYSVDIPGGRCTCPDHTYRGTVCKHLRRVAQEIAEGRVPPPGKTIAECDTCGREILVDETAAPPHHCGECRLSPGDFAVDRRTGDLVVVADPPAGRADETTIPGPDVTVAEYPGNERYPDDDPVVTVLYPLPDRVDSDDIRPHHLRRYHFPLSRLRPAGMDAGS